jgi:GNAT superfamily N-acetyltransferase
VNDTARLPVAIHPASVADVPALAGLLARAFVRDPMVVWPMVTDLDLERRIRAMFEAVDAAFAAEGWMYRTGDGLGAMTLLPPDSEARQAELEAAAAAAIDPLMPDAGERYALMWGWIAETLPAERHWLLDQLAVEPAAQGRGIGGAMLRFAIERARADRLPILLETGVPENVALYGRFGFRVALEGDAPGGGPHIWFMRRDPDAEVLEHAPA